MLSGTIHAACGNLLVDTNLTGAETNAGTCFTFGADNLVLDCQGNSVTVTGGTAVPAIDVDRKNITIRNCRIIDTSATNVAMGALRLTINANNTQVINTNITTIGHYALYVLSQNNTFSQVISTTSSQNSYGSYFSSSSYNNFTNVVFNKTNTVNTYALYYYFGDSNVFDNVVVDSLSTTGGVAVYGAYFYGVTNSIARNSIFTSRNLPAIYMLGSSNYNLLNNITVGAWPTNTAYGVQIDGSIGNNITNSFINSSGAGIYILSNSGYTRMENLTVLSNASSGIYIAATGGSSNYNAINNAYVLVAGYALSFYQDSSNNVVENSTFNSTTNSAFYSYTSSSSNSFVNNTFRSRLSGGAATAVVFTAASSFNIFRNNAIISPPSHALYFSYTASSSNTIENNRIEAAAGAGNGVTFAGASSNSNNISGNNITSLGIGISLYGDYCNVLNNNISAWSNALYLQYSTFANGSNNILRTNSTSGANAIVNLAYSDSNTFVNNTMNHTAVTAAINYGVLLTQSSSNLFSDNTITTYGNDGVRITTSSLSNKFYNNSIYTNATNYYGAVITTNCNNNEFRDDNITSVKGYGVAIASTSRYNVFSGGWVVAGTQNSISLSANANYNNFTGMNITTGAFSQAGGIGIYLTGVTGNRFINVNVTSNASFAVQLTAAVSGSVFSGINAYSARSNALYLYNDVTYNAFRNFNFTSNLTALTTNGNPMPVSYNNFTNGSFTANQTSGYAAYLYYGFNNNVISNVNFTNVGLTTTAGGINLYYASNNNVFNNTNVYAANLPTSYGVYAYYLCVNNSFYNSYIVANFPGTGYDIVIGDAVIRASHLYFINTTFDKASVSFADTASSITVSWYIRGNISDLSGNLPIEAANVTIRDKYANLTSSSLTGSDGLSSWAEAREYRQVSGSSTTYYPYNLSVTIGTVAQNATQDFLPSSTTVPVSINASTCGVITGDYTLTNNVYGATNCLQVGAYGVTVDCGGYYVNYSRSGTGCGLYASAFTGSPQRTANSSRGGTTRPRLQPCAQCPMPMSLSQTALQARWAALSATHSPSQMGLPLRSTAAIRRPTRYCPAPRN
jgi:hypothetical protein